MLMHHIHISVHGTLVGCFFSSCDPVYSSCRQWNDFSHPCIGSVDALDGSSCQKQHCPSVSRKYILST